MKDNLRGGLTTVFLTKIEVEKTTVPQNVGEIADPGKHASLVLGLDANSFYFWDSYAVLTREEGVFLSGPDSWPTPCRQAVLRVLGSYHTPQNPAWLQPR